MTSIWKMFSRWKALGGLYMKWSICLSMLIYKPRLANKGGLNMRVADPMNFFLNQYKPCNPKTANYWKIGQKWVSFKTPLQYIHSYIPRFNWLHSKYDSQVKNCSQKKESGFYFIWLRRYSPLYYDLWLHVIRRDAKYVFGFLAPRAFQRYIVCMISQR